jgi:hypothetical protein
VAGMDLVSVICMQISSFPSNIGEEAIFSPSCAFGAFAKNKVGIAVWIHILFHRSSNLFLCQYHAVFIVIVL